MTDISGTTYPGTDEAMAAGRRGGCDRAVCGSHLLAPSLTTPEAGHCRSCRRRRARA
ncbi:MAG: hypothetical protein ACRDTG_23890 [Pseudonocardiaceae bacterium]